MPPHTYADLLGRFERYLDSRQPGGDPDTLYAPVRYINGLGGKRIRPVLLLMAYNLWQDDITPALPAAMAVEFFHNFTLMHDDIMDEAPLRRGRDTVHTRFGVNGAILSGDAMLINSFALLLEAGREARIGDVLCQRLSEVALEICEGQQLDMDFEQVDAPEEARYLEMIRKKTAVLLGLCLELGGRLAGASEREVRELYLFGERTGLGFQVQDDYLDVFGDADSTGKQKGGDILRGKKNFPYVHHCHELGAADRQRFVREYADAGRDQHIDHILAQYTRAGVDTYTREVFTGLFDAGRSSLESLGYARAQGILDLLTTLAARSS